MDASGDGRKTASQPLGQQSAPSMKEESTQQEKIPMGRTSFYDRKLTPLERT